MATRRPLVIVVGDLKEIPSGDTLLADLLSLLGRATINKNSAAAPAPPTTLGLGTSHTLLHLVGEDSETGDALIDAFAAVPVLSFRRAQGTNASPSNVVAGNQLGAIGALARHSSGYAAVHAAALRFIATEDWSSSNNRGTRFSLWATPAGSLNPTEVLTIGSEGLGFPNNGDGLGGQVTQATDKSTGVTINKPTGQIDMHNATLNAGAAVSFTLTNSCIAASDTVQVCIKSGASPDSYIVGVTAVAAGSCRIQVFNCSGSNLGETLVLNFTVLKGANS